MCVKMEIESFWWLEDNCWSGALETLKTIKENGKEDDFMDLLPMYFDMEDPTMTELNDFLWFEDEIIFEDLGINDEDEDEE